MILDIVGKSNRPVSNVHLSFRLENSHELETVSIAEPLQNWQHAQNP